MLAFPRRRLRGTATNAADSRAVPLSEPMQRTGHQRWSGAGCPRESRCPPRHPHSIQIHPGPNRCSAVRCINMWATYQRQDERIAGPVHVHQPCITRGLRVADVDLDDLGIAVVGDADAVRRRQWIAGTRVQPNAQEQNTKTISHVASRTVFRSCAPDLAQAHAVARLARNRAVAVQTTWFVGPTPDPAPI
jgi:hypothetical protein